MIVIRHMFLERSTGYAYPVVTHEFMGKTLEEARRYFRAHLRYDRMLRTATVKIDDGSMLQGNLGKVEFRSIVRVVNQF